MRQFRNCRELLQSLSGLEALYLSHDGESHYRSQTVDMRYVLRDGDDAVDLSRLTSLTLEGICVGTASSELVQQLQVENFICTIAMVSPRS